MFETFRQCSSLETIDLSGWNTANVTDMKQMFSMSTNNQAGSPTSLKTIYVGDNWSTDKVEKSAGMFELCTKLVGAMQYDPNKLDAQYANYTNGYLTKK
jgi:surface protein